MADDSAATSGYTNQSSTATSSTTTTSTDSNSIPVTGGTDAETSSTSSPATSSTDTTSTDTTTKTSTDATSSNTSTTPTKAATPLPIYVKEVTVETDIGVTISVPATVTNAVGNQTWSVDGDLPDGISIDTTTGRLYGAVTGTPLQDIVELKVTDSANNTGSAVYTIIANPALSAKGEGAATRYVGYSLNTTITGVGGTGSYTYSIENCPTGVAINSLNGTISGTLPTAGAHTLYVLVNDGITTYRYPITFNMIVKVDPPANPSASTNFTQRRMATIGIAKLNEAVKLRTQSPLNEVKAAQDILLATRYLCHDDTYEVLDAFRDVHKTYANSFLREEIFCNGMTNFTSDDLTFVYVVYWSYRQIVHYHSTSLVAWNDLLRLTNSQRLVDYLQDYHRNYLTYGRD